MLSGTQLLAVSRSPSQHMPSSPCSGERSSDVSFRRHLRPSPVASPYATFSFNLVRSPRLRIDYPAINCSTLAFLISTGDPHGVDTALAWKQGEFTARSAGFRPCLCPHRTLSLCCRCAKRKLVGASKARCSDKRYLPRTAAAETWSLSRTSPDLCRKGLAVVESSTRHLHPIPCAHPMS
ncbi:hypothetical protein N658DRAFT_105639 [Parathielavia hyrcaniae]|uniref:Uncharacterized protein n=1 Tax=Parathielavia hyrcaniae TaxID=113614 RepID=A0AAN6T069_9PEZI|nr:hypothetical protein N658DRAFT_105639 [Parathielavia hyrcaniae]